MGKQKGFIPNKAFKKDYDKLFKEDPLQANILLLLCEIADKKGNIIFKKNEDPISTMMKLMDARFNDPGEHQL